mmetsp:Transcript_11868/g.25457  ORF Transcript_11868/g.25457 Transcript_11868/m.25457 type:complete len:260 (-) Transcript_11868:1053-1832(-)
MLRRFPPAFFITRCTSPPWPKKPTFAPSMTSSNGPSRATKSLNRSNSSLGPLSTKSSERDSFSNSNSWFRSSRGPSSSRLCSLQPELVTVVFVTAQAHGRRHGSSGGERTSPATSFERAAEGEAHSADCAASCGCEVVCGGVVAIGCAVAATTFRDSTTASAAAAVAAAFVGAPLTASLKAESAGRDAGGSAPTAPERRRNTSSTSPTIDFGREISSRANQRSTLHTPSVLARRACSRAKARNSAAPRARPAAVMRWTA